MLSYQHAYFIYAVHEIVQNAKNISCSNAQSAECQSIGKLVEDINIYALHIMQSTCEWWILESQLKKVSALYQLQWPMINWIGFVLLCHLLLVLPEFLPHARKCPSIRISAWGKTIGTKTEKKGLKIFNSSICAFGLLLKECCQTGCNFPVKLNQINPFPPHRRLVAPSDTSIMVRLHFSELASPDLLFPDFARSALIYFVVAVWDWSNMAIWGREIWRNTGKWSFHIRGECIQYAAYSSVLRSDYERVGGEIHLDNTK